MTRPNSPDCDLTIVVRARDDEEQIGHVLARICLEVQKLGLSYELLVSDEGSGDNTVVVATLLRRTVPELEVLHSPPGRGLRLACDRARGRSVLLLDARGDAQLSALGYALAKLRSGSDVVALSGRLLVFRRTRAWRAFDAIEGGSRDPLEVERRFLRRARGLGLSCAVTEVPRRTAFSRLRDALRLPVSAARI